MTFNPVTCLYSNKTLRVKERANVSALLCVHVESLRAAEQLGPGAGPSQADDFYGKQKQDVLPLLKHDANFIKRAHKHFLLSHSPWGSQQDTHL